MSRPGANGEIGIPTMRPTPSARTSIGVPVSPIGRNFQHLITAAAAPEHRVDLSDQKRFQVEQQKAHSLGLAATSSRNHLLCAERSTTRNELAGRSGCRTRITRASCLRLGKVDRSAK